MTSARRVAQDRRLSPASRWFVGYDLDERTPDHSGLSKARRRFGVTVYQAFFAEIIRQCRQAGLVAGDQVVADRTLVAANANRAALGSRALRAQVSDPDDYVAAVWRDNPPVRADAPPSADGSHPPAAGPGAGNGAAIGPHRRGPDDQPNVVAAPVNALVASRTDPDAGLVSRPGVPLGLYHTLHVAVNGGPSRLITALDVTPGDIADADVLDRRCEEHEGATRWTLRAVVAAAKYGTHATYRALDDRSILPTIPTPDPRWDDRAVPRAGFAYDPVAVGDRCPEGPPRTCTGCSPWGTGGRREHLPRVAEGGRRRRPEGRRLRQRHGPNDLPTGER